MEFWVVGGLEPPCKSAPGSRWRGEGMGREGRGGEGRGLTEDSDFAVEGRGRGPEVGFRRGAEVSGGSNGGQQRRNQFLSIRPGRSLAGVWGRWRRWGGALCTRNRRGRRSGQWIQPLPAHAATAVPRSWPPPHKRCRASLTATADEIERDWSAHFPAQANAVAPCLWPPHREGKGGREEGLTNGSHMSDPCQCPVSMPLIQFNASDERLV
jgi:hypothetical protein